MQNSRGFWRYRHLLSIGLHQFYLRFPMLQQLTICGLMILVLIAGICAPAKAGKDDGKLDIYFLDAEGGAATLIVTPAGESVLVDTGNRGDRDPDRIFAAARAAGIERLD